MKKLYIITIVLLSLLSTSCKKESLQSYIIESQEKKGFSHVSIPTDVFKFVANSASEADKKAYESIHKINVTGLLADKASEGQYTEEKEKLKAIFDNSDYKRLMNFKNNGVNATLYYTGDADAIDEIIAFGYSEEVGVGVARILGENMNPNAIMNMVKSGDLDAKSMNLGQLKNILDKVK